MVLLKIEIVSHLTQNKSKSPQNDLQLRPTLFPLPCSLSALLTHLPCCSSNTTGVILTQGFCPCPSFCLESSFPRKSHRFLPLLLHISVQYHLLREATPYNIVYNCTHLPLLPSLSMPCLSPEQHGSLSPMKLQVLWSRILFTLFIHVVPAPRRHPSTQ